MNYVDTSLVVTALDRSNPKRSKAAAALLGGSRGKVVSELFLVELASTISRKADLLNALGAEDSQPPTILLAYLLYVMSKFELKLIGPSGERVVTPLGRVSGEAGSSLGLAANLRLRSLDLLHVAHLVSLTDRGYGIETLLTSDAEFLKAESFLKERGVQLIVQKG